MVYLRELGISDADTIVIDSAIDGSIAQIRRIQDICQFSPFGGRRGIIIDEAQELSKVVQNSMLRWLEETSSNNFIIFVTTDAQKLIAPLRSRLIQFDFHPLSKMEILARLKFVNDAEYLKVNTGTLQRISVESDGNLRTAINRLEQESLMVV